MEPSSTSRSISIFCLENFRIVTVAPSKATGGTIMFTREPSLNLASTIGSVSFIRLLHSATICCMTVSKRSELSKNLSVLYVLPALSTKILSGPFTIISVISSSSNKSVKTSNLLKVLNSSFLRLIFSFRGM